MLAYEYRRDRQNEKPKVVGQSGPVHPAGIERREQRSPAPPNRMAFLELLIGARRLPEVCCVQRSRSHDFPPSVTIQLFVRPERSLTAIVSLAWDKINAAVQFMLCAKF